jgi:hypothetical protein
MIDAYARFETWKRDYPSSFAACCAYVARQHETMLAFEARHPAMVHAIRYEQLVAAPEKALRPACAFLGLDFAPEMVNFAGARHDIGFGDEKIHDTTHIVPRIDTFAEWSDEQRLEAQGYLQGCLAALGYDGRPSHAARIAAGS